MEKYSRYSINLALSIIVLCQSIVITAFIFDICYLDKFCYFYKYCWLLIFPLIIRYIIYSIDIYAKVNLESLNHYIYVHVIDNKDLEQPFVLENTPRITLKCISIKDAPLENVYYIHTLSKEVIKENPVLVISNNKRLLTGNS